VVVPVLPLGLAAASAATFGVSTSLQHAVSSRLEASPAHRLMLTLLRTPTWVAGMSLSVAALALHAVALSAGSLVLVQPVIVTGIVFAVLARSALDRRLPSGPEVVWAMVTWAGLAAFLVGTGSPVSRTTPTLEAGPVVAGLLCLAALAAAAARRCPERSVGKGLWLGVSSGVLFGLVAIALKLSLTAATTGLGPLLSSWAPWLTVACGSVAVLVNQRAYQTTRLSVSMPILNIVDVLVAVGFAGAVLGEVPGHGPTALVLEVAGFLAMAGGVARLARLQDPRTAPSVPRPPGAETASVLDPSMVR
jgi:hypothetical protein